MEINLLILAFTVIFMLHNLEEIMTVERWMNRIYPRVKMRVPPFAQTQIKQFDNMTGTRFSFVVFVRSIPVSVIILLTFITEDYFLFLALNLLFAVNIFSHPLQALFLRCYVPGVATSIFLIIPYYIFFFQTFSEAGMLTIQNILRSLVVILLFIPVFLLIHKLSQKWS